MGVERGEYGGRGGCGGRGGHGKGSAIGGVLLCSRGAVSTDGGCEHSQSSPVSGS